MCYRRRGRYLVLSSSPGSAGSRKKSRENANCTSAQEPRSLARRPVKGLRKSWKAMGKGRLWRCCVSMEVCTLVCHRAPLCRSWSHRRRPGPGGFTERVNGRRPGPARCGPWDLTVDTCLAGSKFLDTHRLPGVCRCDNRKPNLHIGGGDRFADTVSPAAVCEEGPFGISAQGRVVPTESVSGPVKTLHCSDDDRSFVSTHLSPSSQAAFVQTTTVVS